MHGIQTRPKRKHDIPYLSDASLFAQHPNQHVNDNTSALCGVLTKKRRTGNKGPYQRGRKRTAEHYNDEEGQTMASIGGSRKIARLSKTRRIDLYPSPEVELCTNTQKIHTEPDPNSSDDQGNKFTDQIACAAADEDDDDDGPVIEVPRFSVIDIPLSVRAQAFLPSYSSIPVPYHAHKTSNKESPTKNNTALVIYNPQPLDKTQETTPSSMDVD